MANSGGLQIINDKGEKIVYMEEGVINERERSNPDIP